MPSVEVIYQNQNLIMLTLISTEYASVVPKTTELRDLKVNSILLMIPILAILDGYWMPLMERKRVGYLRLKIPSHSLNRAETWSRAVDSSPGSLPGSRGFESHLRNQLKGG